MQLFLVCANRGFRRERIPRQSMRCFKLGPDGRAVAQYRLSCLAEADLLDIGSYTLQTWFLGENNFLHVTIGGQIVTVPVLVR
jgi:hypothetical protein